VSLGSLRQSVDFSFTEPRFLGRDVAAGLDAYYYKYDLTRFSAYKTETLGTGVRLNFPLSVSSRGTLGYTLRQDDVSIGDSQCDQALISSVICDQRGSYITSSVSYGYRLDRRNDYLNPTRGFFAGVNQDLAGFGGDVNYLRTEVEGAWYWGFNRDFILSIMGSAGYVDGWAGDTVRINDRFFRGGQNFRGFETAGLGPRDTTQNRRDALGGKAYAIGTVELSIPTFLPEQYGIKAGLFTDVGTVGLLDKEDKLCRENSGPSCPAGTINPFIRDDLSLRAAAGLSIHWRSPMGPIRFDFSQILAKEDYDRTETFRFSTSTRF
jgi:outer membrane protein insertion porin family